MFEDFIDKQNVKIAEVKEIHIKRYNIYLKEKGYSNHTIARKNSSLRMFFKYMRKQGLMKHNPIEDIKQPELTKKESSLKEKDIMELENIIKEGGSERDYLLFKLANLEKIRLNELIKLKKEHFNQNQGILYLTKKAISLKDETKKMLEEYILSIDGDFLFTNQHNKPLTESGVYFVMKSYIGKIEKENIRPIDISL